MAAVTLGGGTATAKFKSSSATLILLPAMVKLVMFWYWLLAE